ncbi:MAG TPA: RidA family protein [Pyrinomonadaceae bacterium]|nr:RidA family protein [Pyrinomonadaceae bacterium]
MKTIWMIVVVVCFCTAAVLETRAQTKHAIEYKGRPGSAFSEVVRVDNMLYLSGQLGVNASGSLVSGGIKAETKQVMDNIRGVLEKNGSGMEHVVKCTVMLLDIAERPAMSEVYVGYFPKDRMPARSTFGTTGLALGARVEIECMATVK